MKRGTQEIKKTKKLVTVDPRAKFASIYRPLKTAILDQQSTSFRQIRVSGSPHGQVAEPDIQETCQKMAFDEGLFVT